MSTATVTTHANSHRDFRSAEKRFLVATTGGPESRGALRLASVLAARGDTAVMAVGVAPVFPLNALALISIQAPARDSEPRIDVLDRIHRSVRGLPDSDRWTIKSFSGIPEDVINDTASRWDASLILIGIGRHNLLDRMFRNEAAIAVIRSAKVPVLAVPSRTRTAPTQAVAAVDFTPASFAAALLAADLLEPDGTLILAHVCAFRGVPSKAGDLVDVYRAGARAKLENAAHRLRQRTKRHVDVVMLEGGDPGEVILRYARRERCDLIALGGQEHGLMDRILLGSVRTTVVRGTSCPVLIAPSARS